MSVGSLVLLVEDQDMVRAALERALRHLGFSVKGVADATQAQQFLTSTSADVLVSDVSLGEGLSGPELVDWARRRWPGMPAVLISGAPSSTTAIEADASGITRFLLKPVTIADIRKAVTEVLAQAEAQRAGAPG